MPNESLDGLCRVIYRDRVHFRILEEAGYAVKDELVGADGFSGRGDGEVIIEAFV